MDRGLVKLSKALAKLLRHRPERYGVELDEAGWATVDDVVRGLTGVGHHVDRAILDAVVAENDKQRYEYSADGARIRARQGHSIHVELGLEPCAPPGPLFHGTVVRNLESIRVEGLLRGGRQHVHLSATVETAMRVGARRGKPVILRVEAARMHADGYLFYRSANGVWLTEHVPAGYLAFP